MYIMGKTPKVFFLMLLFIILFSQCAYGGEDQILFSQGIDFVRSQKFDFALMDFRRLSRSYPKSRFSKKALFATGEYYFLIGDYYDAVIAFQKFITTYPQSKIKQFALAYLLKIAEKDGKRHLAQSLKAEIISSQQLSLLFKDSKEYSCLSAMRKKYRAKYFIDKAEFYVDEELFIKISY
jgi:outer membrane protein assembly factor BamD (BamD/ComL family)